MKVIELFAGIGSQTQALKNLVKQLFTTTKNKDKVQYKHMDHYPFSGYSAMSWCGYILTKKKESDIKTTTWNRENIHLQQAENKGSWLKYYADHIVTGKH